jgi:hypothetical protein
MKTARIGCMVLGIALLMFVIAPNVSAQVTGEWFKGNVSLKGYEVNVAGDVNSKESGKGTVYVNIVHGTGVYTVTTCMEDMKTDDVWQLADPTVISENAIFTDPDGKYQIWDFFSDASMYFYPDAQIWPMIKVTTNGNLTKASFKSFACAGYNGTDPVYSLGACTISFKNLDSAKVPRGATGCIITGP